MNWPGRRQELSPGARVKLITEKQSSKREPAAAKPLCLSEGQFYKLKRAALAFNYTSAQNAST